MHYLGQHGAERLNLRKARAQRDPPDDIVEQMRNEAQFLYDRGAGPARRRRRRRAAVRQARRQAEGDLRRRNGAAQPRARAGLRPARLPQSPCVYVTTFSCDFRTFPCRRRDTKVTTAGIDAPVRRKKRYRFPNVPRKIPTNWLGKHQSNCFTEHHFGVLRERFEAHRMLGWLATIGVAVSRAVSAAGAQAGDVRPRRCSRTTTRCSRRCISARRISTSASNSPMQAVAARRLRGRDRRAGADAVLQSRSAAGEARTRRAVLQARRPTRSRAAICSTRSRAANVPGRHPRPGDGLSGRDRPAAVACTNTACSCTPACATRPTPISARTGCRCARSARMRSSSRASARSRTGTRSRTSRRATPTS